MFPAGSVAVAVMTWPEGTEADSVAVKLAFPAASVVTVVKPRKRKSA